MSFYSRFLGPAALAALFFCHQACAAESLDLAQAQSEGLEQSPELARARALSSEKQWSRVGALSVFMPHLSLDGTRYFEDKYQVLPFNGATFPEVSPYAQFGMDASWTLFDGWAGINTLRASDLSAAAAALSRDWALVQVRQNIRLKFYRALASQKLDRLADENIKTLKVHLRIVKDLLANGRATRFDLLRVEVQLDDARTDQMESYDKVALARLSLAQAMGLDEDARPLRGQLPFPRRAPADAPSIDEKLDLKAKLLEAEAAENRSLAAAGHWAPRLSVVGTYQWYRNGYRGDQMDPAYSAAQGTNYDLGLTATWDLFNGGGSLAREMESARKADEAKQTAKEARLQVAYDRELWKRRLSYSTQLYQAKLADVDKARESVRLATVGLKAGTRTTTEVLDAELDSFRAAASEVSAQMDAAEALINLELALGMGDLQ